MVIDDFIECIGAALHACRAVVVEKIARIAGRSIIGQFRDAAVQRKIRGRRGFVAAVKQPLAGAGEAEQVKNVWLRTIGLAAQRMSQFMQRHPDQSFWRDVGVKGDGGVVGGGVVRP